MTVFVHHLHWRFSRFIQIFPLPYEVFNSVDFEKNRQLIKKGNFTQSFVKILSNKHFLKNL